MLGDEDRMAAERGLLAVVARVRRREPLVDERARVVEHGRETLRRQVVALLWPQAEAFAKRRLRQSREDLVKVAHAVTLAPGHKEPHCGASIGSSS